MRSKYNVELKKDFSLQNNMPGMDFRGKRPDMGRNQAGMQQIEVGT